MLENIKKFMDEFEAIYDKAYNGRELTIDDKMFMEYSDFHLAEALMKDWGDSKKVAKIILAATEEH